jgi:hypothetical protein
MKAVILITVTIVAAVGASLIAYFAGSEKEAVIPYHGLGG